MYNKYVTPEQFEKIAKGKKVKDYPNPLCKEIDDVHYEIIKPEARCKVSKMPHDHYEWFIGVSFPRYQQIVREKLGEDNSEVVVISTDTKAGYYWFPTDLVCGTVPHHIGAGIIRDKFDPSSELARRTGFIGQRNNTGSFECYFRSSKVKEAIAVLEANNWHCEKYEE